MARTAIEGANNLGGGLVTNIPSHLLRRSQTPNGINFDPSNQDGVTKRGGYAAWSDAGPSGTIAAVRGMFQGRLATTPYAKHTLLASDNATPIPALFTVPETGAWTEWTQLPGPVTLPLSSDKTDIHMFNDLIIILNSGGGPWKSDGSSSEASDLGIDATSQAIVELCSIGEVHKGRLWLSGRAPEPNKIFWSDLHDPTSWEPDADAGNAGFETLNKNDGRIINGIKSGGEVLYVSKISPPTSTNPFGTEGSIYAYFGTDNINFSSIRKVANFPAVNHKAMFNYDGVLVMASPNGVYSISGKGVALLSRDIQDIYEAIADKFTIQIGRYRNQLWISYDSTGDGNNDSVLVLDVARGRWSRYTGSIGNIGCLTNDVDTGGLLFAQNAATQRIYESPIGTNDNGSAINFHWETPDLDWGDFFLDKLVKQFFIYTLDTGDFDIKITRILDGDPQVDVPDMSVNVQGTGAIDKLVTRTITPSSDRNSRFTRFKLENNELNEPITLRGYAAYAEILEPTR